MAKRVVVTKLAQITYNDVLEYLIANWGEIVTNNFIERFEEVCKALAKNPQIFPFKDKVKQVQYCVLTKHNVLYFKEVEEMIQILIIFDTRQNPEKLLSWL
jgi:plasmid stabilization system protein ParE